jgi:glutamyl-tRNA synthetase
MTEVTFPGFVQAAVPPVRVRYAPTPSGYLHAGNAVNFILNYLLARSKGGHILLRIDDLDGARKRSPFVQDIFDALNWLGIDYDEGPMDQVDFESRWSQHFRLTAYNKTLERLRASGLLFACSKSRSDLSPFGGMYPAEFRDQGLHLDDPDVAWRIRTPDNFPMPDFIVRRRDGLPAYQIASLTDDLLFEITHIIRGADLEPSTQAQRFLAGILGETAFLSIQPLHHPLIQDASGAKLSKSAGATSLKSLREQGKSPEAIFLRVADMLDLPDDQVFPDALSLLTYLQRHCA